MQVRLENPSPIVSFACFLPGITRAPANDGDLEVKKRIDCLRRCARGAPLVPNPSLPESTGCGPSPQIKPSASQHLKQTHMEINIWMVEFAPSSVVQSSVPAPFSCRAVPFRLPSRLLSARALGEEPGCTAGRSTGCVRSPELCSVIERSFSGEPSIQLQDAISSFFGGSNHHNHCHRTNLQRGAYLYVLTAVTAQLFFVGRRRPLPLGVATISSRCHSGWASGCHRCAPSRTAGRCRLDTCGRRSAVTMPGEPIRVIRNSVNKMEQKRIANSVEEVKNIWPERLASSCFMRLFFGSQKLSGS